MTKTVQIEKTAKVAVTKPVAKPAAKTIDASAAIMAALTASVTKTATPPAAKAKTNAERFPTAAKAEAAAKAAGTKVANPDKVAKVAVEKVTKVAAAKPVEVPFVSRLAVHGKPVYAISESDGRPTAGARLFAHTHAALTMFGMLDATTPAVPKRVVLSVMGSTAVKWHLAKGNFEDAPNMCIRLSTSGRNKFLARPIDTKLANGFLGIFLDGKVGDTGINPSSVYQFA